ncbi:methylated-DNA--[protein]-cysteine S-methyltransferase [Jeongeupia chitinilytica]|uniref:Bifunctional transcriptional activator/DNA repair enzyme protein Ada n=1 Tax=Jeongeupia chitinilytica TaxID=1041641 RepID=A0ABQ3H331_9NEIS|nr:methylated-DNA--[protein]-cysteine S-methyltransferase [Jeongeupia chitinilytica]GHD68007.1 bifunctional transcriptional activator/DNA repair enzyme protein Ada [Jeongeupia chitinilytica]
MSANVSSAIETLIAAACRQIDAAETPPPLAELAAVAGLSPWHFHRQFKALTGVTPKAYAAAQRTRRVQAALAAGRSVTDAVFDAGFNATSRFYAGAEATLGMAPQRFRAGGSGEEIRFGIGQCSLGALLVAATGAGICRIELGDDADTLLQRLQDVFPKATLIGGDAEFEGWMARVVGLIDAPEIGASLPLDIRGSAFQQRVWQALRAIPPGDTATYAEIAERIGQPAAVRAVANACGTNPLAVAIPCHRVVRSDGGLGGYRWGLARKEALLDREALQAG